ncbi:MAG TPA: hypothetical protein VK206_19025, partial [Anaerolineales bacterium]|nr:hypothetical protein [Anaerolineales bacterium]
AGLGRVIIEFFRPDQPKIPGLGISYSSIVAALMAITGVILLMARYKAINFKWAENWEEEYHVGEKVQTQEESEEPAKEKRAARVKKLSPAAAKRVVKKKTPRRGTKTTETASRAPQAKKS